MSAHNAISRRTAIVAGGASLLLPEVTNAGASNSKYEKTDTPNKIRWTRRLTQNVGKRFNRCTLHLRFFNLNGRPVPFKYVQLRWKPYRKNAAFALLQADGTRVRRKRTNRDGEVVFTWTQRVQNPQQNEGGLIYRVKRRRVIATFDIPNLVLC